MKKSKMPPDLMKMQMVKDLLRKNIRIKVQEITTLEQMLRKKKQKNIVFTPMWMVIILQHIYGAVMQTIQSHLRIAK